jgi:hypothetical protein
VERVHAYVVSALVLVAIMLPVLWQPHDDSFPLSTYPMFAHRRGRENDVTRALAISADGSEAPVPPRYVANAETMQAFYTISRAVHAGSGAAAQLCEAIAARIPNAREPELAHAQRVSLVTERVDAIDYLAGRAKPSDRRVHAECAVEAKEAR